MWYRTLLLCLIAGCPSVGWCQQATVVGPTTSDPGDLIILDASSSVGSGHSWVLANSTKTWLSFEEGRKLVFSSGSPGEYVFILGVTQDDRVSLVKHVVVIGKPLPDVPKPDVPKPDEPKPDVPKPDPPKPKPEPPTPVLTAMATAAKAAVLQCQTKPGEALSMAAHFEKVASQAGALNWDLDKICAEMLKSPLSKDADMNARWKPFNTWFVSVAEVWESPEGGPEKAASDMFEMAIGLQATAAGSVSGVMGDGPNETLRGKAEEIRRQLQELDGEIGRPPL